MSKKKDRPAGVNPENQKPTGIRRLSDQDRKEIEAAAILNFPDSIRIYAETDGPNRQTLALDPKALKAICREWQSQEVRIKAAAKILADATVESLVAKLGK
jgi:hypothetical protein